MAAKNQTKTQPKAASKSGAPTRYIVLHSMVGSWLQDDIITEADLPAGADFDRLISLGALGIAPPQQEGEPEERAEPILVPPPVTPITPPAGSGVTVVPPTGEDDGNT